MIIIFYDLNFIVVIFYIIIVIVCSHVICDILILYRINRHIVNVLLYSLAYKYSIG